MKRTCTFQRADGTTFKAELTIDVDALALYMARKADRNVSKKCTQVERTIKLVIIE